jgi:hypothetical protein
MKKIKNSIAFILLAGIIFCSCGKSSSEPQPEPAPVNFILTASSINGATLQTITYNIATNPSIKFSFSSAINKSTVSNSISFTENSGTLVSYNVSYSNGDSSFILTPAQSLKHLGKYRVSISQSLKSPKGGSLTAGTEINFITTIDSTDKFPQIADTELLDLVQKQTFKYFWDCGHPTSGLARERSNGDNNIVTSGGSGFGVMAIVAGIERAFITRAQGLAKMQTIVSFLKNTAQKHKGAFPHWLNGQTGITIPFSQKDNGADLVETSYLIQGLLCARQYFDRADVAETALRNDINTIWQGVEWDFFRKNNENVLYWHWSPDHSWDMNMPIRGWNECLITYVLAASSPTHSIPKIVYDAGWAQNGAMKNGGNFLGYTLPLGPNYGGPLFFSHYSFLGIDPKGLTDQYAAYETQVTNHTKINYEYCKTNPKNYFGYSDQCWGLTASDIPNGYTASSPTNDVGVIAPTAALSSFPYTPTESMKALKFFYYKLGDKLWSDYGFRDAFSLKDIWFANSHLAIDQGPIIVMIENYRTGLLWNLFMSCPEVKTGMKALGFQGPHL